MEFDDDKVMVDLSSIVAIVGEGEDSCVVYLLGGHVLPLDIPYDVIVENLRGGEDDIVLN